MGLKVASKLLNRESRSFAQALLDIRYIPREKILKNPKNRVSIAGIEELAQDIKMAGLEQPLVVYPKDGKYVLLTGERRLTAIDRLIESGDWDPERELIPCIERPLDMYKLPLDEELKEVYAILRTNAFNRKLTDADLVTQTEYYTRIIRELKKQGYKDLIIGYDDNGEPIKKDITGRVRQTVAGMVGASTGQVGKIESILKNGSKDLKKVVRSGEITIAAAHKLSGLTEEQQDSILRQNVDPKITASEVEKKIVSLEKDKAENSGYNAVCEEKGQEEEYSNTFDGRKNIRDYIQKIKKTVRMLESACDRDDKNDMESCLNNISSCIGEIFAEL